MAGESLKRSAKSLTRSAKSLIRSAEVMLHIYIGTFIDHIIKSVLVHLICVLKETLEFLSTSVNIDYC